MRAQEHETVTPPPWKLQGDGLILLYRFAPDFVNAHVSSEMGSFRGGLGAVLLVDYATSAVGPYRELLFSPGRFELGGKRGHSISRIYVSSETSLASGRANWGIPKEYADFRRTHIGGVQSWHVSVNGQSILQLAYTPGRVAFRVWTWPLFVPIVQYLDGRLFVTRLRAHGVCKLATIHEIVVDPDYFPDTGGIEPLGVVRVSRFRMTFPPARISG